MELESPMPARRSYDARSRREGAARNRAAVLAACRELLFRDGYHRMTVRSVAEWAGVSPETVYKAFGGKPGLMKALWDATLAGDDEPVAMADRPQLRKVWSTVEPSQKLRGYAEFVRGVNQRLAALFDLLAQAGPEVTPLLSATERERLAGVRAFVAHLADSNLLAPGRDPVTAADACWALTGPRLYLELSTGRGWDAGLYETWLARMLAANLLPPAQHAAASECIDAP
jgi:AcrR family transcriptional regulator